MPFFNLRRRSSQRTTAKAPLDRGTSLSSTSSTSRKSTDTIIVHGAWRVPRSPSYSTQVDDKRRQEESDSYERLDSNGQLCRRSIMRPVNHEDYLVARGANPRTGLITPMVHSANGSMSNDDPFDSRFRGIPSKWRQRGDQWVSLDAEQPTPPATSPQHLLRPMRTPAKLAPSKPPLEGITITRKPVGSPPGKPQNRRPFLGPCPQMNDGPYPQRPYPTSLRMHRKMPRSMPMTSNLTNMEDFVRIPSNTNTISTNTSTSTPIPMSIREESRGTVPRYAPVAASMNSRSRQRYGHPMIAKPSTFAKVERMDTGMGSVATTSTPLLRNRHRAMSRPQMPARQEGMHNIPRVGPFDMAETLDFVDMYYPPNVTNAYAGRPLCSMIDRPLVPDLWRTDPIQKQETTWQEIPQRLNGLARECTNCHNCYEEDKQPSTDGLTHTSGNQAYAVEQRGHRSKKSNASTAPEFFESGPRTPQGGHRPTNSRSEFAPQAVIAPTTPTSSMGDTTSTADGMQWGESEVDERDHAACCETCCKEENWHTGCLGHPSPTDTKAVIELDTYTANEGRRVSGGRKRFSRGKKEDLNSAPMWTFVADVGRSLLYLLIAFGLAALVVSVVGVVVSLGNVLLSVSRIVLWACGVRG